VKAGLKALARWEQNKFSWDYANGEMDYAAANALLEPLEDCALSLVLKQAETECGMVMQVLHTQNVLLAQSLSVRPEKPNLKYLLAARPEEPRIAEESVHKKVTRALSVRGQVLAGRSEFQAWFKRLISCYQGTGQKVLAFNMDRLNAAWSAQLPPVWLPILHRANLIEEVKDVLERVSPNGLPALVEDMQAALELMLPQASEAFDESHARVAWRDEMRLLVKDAVQLSIWPENVRPQKINETIDRLSQEENDSTIRRLRKIRVPSDESDDLARLWSVSQVPLPRLTQLYSDVVVLVDLFTTLGKLINAQTGTFESNQALEVRKQLVERLVWEE
jgi:hypothetical protein